MEYKSIEDQDFSLGNFKIEGKGYNTDVFSHCYSFDSYKIGIVYNGTHKDTHIFTQAFNQTFRSYLNYIIEDKTNDYLNEMEIDVQDSNKIDLEDYAIEDLCLQIDISYIDLTKNILDITIYYNEYMFPLEKQYIDMKNIEMRDRFQHQKGHNRNYEVWEKYKAISYFEIQNMCQKIFVEMKAHQMKSTTIQATDVQILFVPMKNNQSIYSSIFLKKFQMYLYPILIIAIYYLPFLFIVQEMIEDIKTFRVKRFVIMGLSSTANMLAWTIFVFLTSFYHAIVVYFMTGLSTIRYISSFWMVFFYGLTLLGGGYLASNLLVIFKQENNVIVFTILFQTGAYFISQIVQMCLLYDFSIYITFLQIICPSIALKQGIITIFAVNLEKYQGIKIECTSSETSTAIIRLILSAIFYSQLGMCINYYIKHTNILNDLDQLKPSTICWNKQKIPIKQSDLNLNLNDTVFSDAFTSDTLINQISRNMKSKLTKLDRYIHAESLSISQYKTRISHTFYESFLTIITGPNGSGVDEFIQGFIGLKNKTTLKKIRAYKLSQAFNETQNFYQMLGFATTLDNLFPRVTVREYLKIFAQFKNIEPTKIRSEVDKYLELMNLKFEENHQVYFLTNGEVMKLKIALTLIGDPKLIIIDMQKVQLDEQTQQNLIMYLRQERRDRVIILINNNLEVIEIGNDRLISLKKGQIHCDADSQLLLKYYKPKYYITIYKEDLNNYKQFSKKIKEMSDKLEDTMFKSNNSVKFHIQEPTQKEEFINNLRNFEQRNQNVSYTVFSDVYLPTLTSVENQDFAYNQFKQGFKQFESVEAEKSKVKQLKQLYSLIKYNFKEHRDYYWLKQLLYSLLIFIIITFSTISKTFYNIQIDGYPATQDVELNFFDFVRYDRNTNDFTYKNQNYSLDLLLEHIDNYYYGKMLWHDCNSRLDYYIGGILQILEPPTNVSSFIVFSNHSKEERAIQIFGDQVFKQHMIQTIEEDVTYNLKSKNIDSKYKNYGNDVIVIHKYLDEEKHSLPIWISFFLYVIGDEILRKVLQMKGSEIRRHTLTKVSSFILWLAQYISDLIFTFLPVLIVQGVLISYYYGDVPIEKNSPFYLQGFQIFIALWLIFPLYIYFIALFVTKLHSARALVFGLLVGCAGITVELLYQQQDGAFYDNPAYDILASLSPITLYNLLMIYIIDMEIIQKNNMYDLYFVRNVHYYYTFATIAVLSIILYEHRIPKVFSKLTYYMTCCGSCQKYKRKRTLYNSSSMTQLGESLLRQRNSTIFEKSDIENESKEILIIKNLTLQSFFPYPKIILHDITFNVFQGECVAIVADGTGAGLTTLIESIAGKHYLSGGNVKIIGKTFDYCKQEYSLEEDLTIEEILYKEGSLVGYSDNQIRMITDFLCEQFSLTSFKQKQISSLGKVIQKKVQLIVTLFNTPQVICMDEPFQGLDISSTKALMRIMGSLTLTQKHGILFTTKTYEEAEEIADQIGILSEGRMIAFGSLRQLQDQYCKMKLEVKVIIRVSNETIEQMKYEHDFKRKLKVTLKNVEKITRDLKLDYLTKLLINKEDQSTNMVEMRNTLQQGKLLYVDEFIHWALTEHQGRNVLQEMKQQFQNVETLEHIGPVFKFLIGSNEDRILNTSDLVSFIENKKSSFNIVEYKVSPPTLSSIVKSIMRPDSPPEN